LAPDVADEVAIPDPEYIPDDATLSMRAHKTHFLDGELQPGVFKFRKEHGYQMSTDWANYRGRSPEDTRAGGQNPRDNGVLTLPVAGIRQIEGLSVRHTPLPSNHAHTDVAAEQRVCEDRPTLVQIRLKLLQLSRIIIMPD
jgi:hypothetical protein